MTRGGAAVAAGGALCALVAIQRIAAGGPQDVALLALYPLAYAVGAYLPRWAAAAGLMLALAAAEVVAMFGDGAWVPALFAIAPWLGGRLTRSQRELVEQLRDRTRELEAEQSAYARLAVQHERARIARELHDVISHNLAVVVVQAGAGRVAPTSAADRAAGRFASIRQAGERGLEELSWLTDILRAEPPDDGLGMLIDQARSTGIIVHSPDPPADLDLPPQIAQTVYRVLQEALTNAIKHAPGAELTVRVALREVEVELQVLDDGGHNASSQLRASGSQIGLHGMRERVAELGGDLSAGRREGGGWHVTARLPLGSPPA
jgi:signal transduction histidine kinase